MIRLIIILITVGSVNCKGFQGMSWTGAMDSLALHCDVLGGADAKGSSVICDALAANVANIRARFIADQLMTSEEFDAAFGSIRIEIYDEWCLPDYPDHFCVYGAAQGLGERLSVITRADLDWRRVLIKLNRDGDALGHEAHHVLDMWANVGNTGQHPHWDAKGYFARSDDLAHESWSLH